MSWGTATLLAFLLCFATFTWAMQGGLFRVTPGTRPGLTAVRVLGSLGMAVHGASLWVALNRSEPGAPLAFALYGTSLGLFIWAARTTWHERLTLAFAVDLPTHLVTGGPYRFVRHPFYTSYLLAWVAGVPATGEPALLVTVLVMGSLYVRAARQEERKFAGSALRTEHRAYRARTGMFVPVLIPRPQETSHERTSPD